MSDICEHCGTAFAYCAQGEYCPNKECPPYRNAINEQAVNDTQTIAELTAKLDAEREDLEHADQHIREKAAETWMHVFQGIEEPCGCENHRKLAAARAERDRRIRREEAELWLNEHYTESEDAIGWGYKRIAELSAPVPAEGEK